MRLRLLTGLAALTAWALVAEGGVVRVTESGLGCPHWPLCTERALPLDQRASVIEYSHRALVALAAVLVVAVAILAWRTHRSRPDVLRPAVAAVALLPVQALLGAVAVWLELPGWVVAFHFVLGMLFLGTIVLTATAAFRRPDQPATLGFTRLAGVGVLVGLALVSVGAAVVAAGADAACGTQWPACNGGFAAGGGPAELQVAHRMLAYTLVAVAAMLLVLALRGSASRLVGSAPLVATLAQIGLGIGVVLTADGSRAHELFAGAHEAGAGIVWGLVVAVATVAASGGRASRPARPGRTATTSG